ncbi:lysylphosphatidylglycerol synthase transmembrane domain-containing protein [Cellulomonas sp. NPDC089187]|uniref:lysylphosphatidylglycerol synthase transmembrane domain-containing protein n=1 Tax=Cellulomonas sp. NPDC089187 TaxID=3154970 RepID=UPI003440E22F
MPSTPHSSGRAVLGRVLRVVALLVVAVFAIVFLAREWDGFVAGLRQLEPWAVVSAVAAIMAGLICAMLSWRAVLQGMGSTLPVRASARVYFLGQLGKYVPGSVWPIVAQAELSKEYQVPRARAAVGALTQTVIGLVVGVCVAGITLAVSSPDVFATYWWLLLVAVVGVITLLPPVLNRLMALALKLTRRGTSERMTAASIGKAAAWCLGMWFFFGVHLWLLATGVSAPGEHHLFLLATGAYALAWVVGFVIVILPAGAGAREAALVLALGSALSRENALMLAVVSRVLMLIGDAVGAGVAVVVERQRLRRHPELADVVADAPQD